MRLWLCASSVVVAVLVVFGLRRFDYAPVASLPAHPGSYILRCKISPDGRCDEGARRCRLCACMWVDSTHGSLCG